MLYYIQLYSIRMCAAFGASKVSEEKKKKKKWRHTHTHTHTKWLVSHHYGIADGFYLLAGVYLFRFVFFRSTSLWLCMRAPANFVSRVFTWIEHPKSTKKKWRKNANTGKLNCVECKIDEKKRTVKQRKSESSNQPTRVKWVERAKKLRTKWQLANHNKNKTLLIKDKNKNRAKQHNNKKNRRTRASLTVCCYCFAVLCCVFVRKQWRSKNKVTYFI